MQYNVSSGQIDSTGVVLGAGDTLTVSSGGAAYAVTVNSGGDLTVDLGGGAFGILVSSGGEDSVYGAVTTGSIYASGAETIQDGGIATSTTVYQDGQQTVSVGGLTTGTVLSGGFAFIDGSATSTTIYSGQQIDEPGGLAFDTKVEGGAEYVNGAASGAHVVDGGLQEVQLGGTATSTSIGYDGVQIVNGGTANDTIVNFSGELDVFGGAEISGSVMISAASGVTNSALIYGGTEAVSSGGLANATSVSFASQVISSGGSSSDTLIGYDGSEVILAGGIADGATVQLAGNQQVSSGGITSDTVVSSGGVEVVSSGGTADDTTVESGGLLVLLPGAMANGTVSAGGTVISNPGVLFYAGSDVVSAAMTVSGVFVENEMEVVNAGGSAIASTVSYGNDTINSGGLVISTLLESGAELVSSGGTALDTEVGGQAFGSEQDIYAGGEATGTVLDDGYPGAQNYQNIDGGVASDTTIGSDDIQYVSGGGVADDTDVLEGGIELVSSGGITSDTDVQSGGTEIVSSGGTADATTVEPGGTLLLLPGASAYDTVSAGGMVVSNPTVLFYSGAAVISGALTVSGASIYDETEVVNSGGSAVASEIVGGSDIINSGGVVVSTFLESAVESVSSGGIALDTEVFPGYLDNGAEQDIYAGGETTGTVLEQSALNYSSLQVIYGGVASDTIISYGAVQLLSSGGTAEDTDVQYGGIESVSSGGTADDTDVQYGGIESVSSGGITDDTDIQNGGTEIVLGGGTANSTTIESGATLVLLSGALANATVNSGGTVVSNPSVLLYSGSAVIFGASGAYGLYVENETEVVNSGGSAVASDILSGSDTINSGGVVISTILESGVESVSSGGIALDTEVIGTSYDYESKQNIYAGGETTGTVLEPDDLGYPNYQIIYGGVADSTIIYSAATQYVSSGGIADETDVQNGGTELVSNGGISNDTDVQDGGSEVISSGGIAIGTTVEIGSGLDVLAGGLTSDTIISSGGVETVSSGGTADGTTILSGGVLRLLPGALASDTVSVGGVATSAAVFFIYSGSAVISTVVDVLSGANITSGESVEITDGASAVSSLIASGGSAIIDSGAAAQGLSVGGYEEIEAGGIATGTIVAGGVELVDSRGTAKGSVISSGTQHVEGTAIGSEIGNGGELYLEYGTASSATVSSGGQISSYEGIDNYTVIDGGSEVIEGYYSTTTQSVSALLTNSGTQAVEGNGVASAAVVEDGSDQVVDAGAATTGTVISSGGTEIVRSGGYADDTTVMSGGTLIVLPGAIVSATINDGGSVTSGGVLVLSGDFVVTYATSTLASASVTAFDVQEYVLSGGVAISSLVTDGIVTIDAGGSALGLSVGDGGSDTILSGGSASGTLLSGFDGYQEEDERVDSGGTAIGTIVDNSGFQTISSGGTASATIVNSGGNLDNFGGSDSGTLIGGGGTETVDGSSVSATIGADAIQNVYGTATAAIVESGGTQTVYGVTSDTIISSGGTEYVESGGAAAATTVLSGGSLVIAPGGVASETVSAGGVVISGDNVFLFSGASVVSAAPFVISGAVVGADESEVVSSGGSAVGSVIASGGSAVVYSGGVASSVIIEDQGFSVLAGGFIASSTVAAGGSAYIAGVASAFSVESGGYVDVYGSLVDPVVAAGGDVLLDINYYDDDQSGELDLTTLAFTASGSISYDSSGVLMVTEGSSTVALPYLHFPGLLDSNIDLEPDGTGGTTISLDDIIPCYAEGTQIATPHGEIPVEALTTGDPVHTHTGAPAAVVWIGHRSIDCTRHPQPQQVWPIRIRAGAFGDTLPSRDLRLSPEHAIFQDGVLIPVRLLVNGISIVQEPCERITYYHVELPRHDVMLAEGLPCESYLDAGNRSMFANCPVTELYPDFARDAGQVWRHDACAPLIQDGIALHAVRARLDARAGIVAATDQSGELRGWIDSAAWACIRGWAWQPQHPGAHVHLEILDGETLLGEVRATEQRDDVRDAGRLDISDGAALLGRGSGRCGFTFHPVPPLSPLVAHTIRVRRKSDGAAVWNSGQVVIEPVPRLDAGALGAFAASLRATATDAGPRSTLLGFMAGETDWLQTQLAARSIGAGPLALFIDHAARDHMSALGRLGYRVACAAGDAADIAALQAQGIRVCRPPAIASVEEMLRRLGPDAAVVYLPDAETMSLYAPLVRYHCPRALLIYRASRPGQLRREQERHAASMADRVITHSMAEAALLCELAPKARVHVVPWSVPLRPVATPFVRRYGLAFIGGYRHAPNVDAARWLMTEIMPLVWQQVPDLPCLLVGSDMPADLLRIDRPGIVALGHVPDLAGVFEHVRLTVAPLRYGAGLKGKVLHSLAAGVPCVGTPVAAEGLALRDCVAGDAAGLAAAIVRLHSDAAGNAACAEAGLRLVGEAFSAERIDALLGAVLGPRHAVADRAARRSALG